MQLKLKTNVYNVFINCVTKEVLYTRNSTYYWWCFFSPSCLIFYNLQRERTTSDPEQAITQKCGIGGALKRTNERILTPFTSTLLPSFSHPCIFYHTQSQGLDLTRNPSSSLFPARERRPGSCLYDVCANDKFVFALEGIIAHNIQHACVPSWQQRGQLTYIAEVAVGPPFWAVSTFQGAWLWKEEHILVLLPHCPNVPCKLTGEGGHTFRVWLPSRLLEMVETLHWATVW